MELQDNNYDCCPGIGYTHAWPCTSSHRLCIKQWRRATSLTCMQLNMNPQGINNTVCMKENLIRMTTIARVYSQRTKNIVFTDYRLKIHAQSGWHTQFK